MVERTQSLDGEAAVGDILVKIRGRHYLIPAEAIGSPLEDGGSEILGMLEKELSSLEATTDSRMIGVDFVMELGGGDDRNARAITDDRNARAITDDRNARAITARQSRQCVEPTRSARQCVEPTRAARQCTEPTRSARQCVEPARAARQCTEPTRSARQCTEPTRSARQCVRTARAIHPQAA
jgi:hypothetical protein